MGGSQNRICRRRSGSGSGSGLGGVTAVQAIELNRGALSYDGDTRRRHVIRQSDVASHATVRADGESPFRRRRRRRSFDYMRN